MCLKLVSCWGAKWPCLLQIPKEKRPENTKSLVQNPDSYHIHSTQLKSHLKWNFTLAAIVTSFDDWHDNRKMTFSLFLCRAFIDPFFSRFTALWNEVLDVIVKLFAYSHLFFGTWNDPNMPLKEVALSWLRTVWLTPQNNLLKGESFMSPWKLIKFTKNQWTKDNFWINS